MNVHSTSKTLPVFSKPRPPFLDDRGLRVHGRDSDSVGGHPSAEEVDFICFLDHDLNLARGEAAL